MLLDLWLKSKRLATSCHFLIICEQFSSNVRLDFVIGMIQDQREGVKRDVEKLTTLFVKSESGAAENLKGLKL